MINYNRTAAIKINIGTVFDDENAQKKLKPVRDIFDVVKFSLPEYHED